MAEKYNLKITVFPVGTGATVPDIGTTTYDPGVQVAVKATPVDGKLFIGWSGDNASNDPIMIVSMDRDMSIVANFGTPADTPAKQKVRALVFPGGTDIPHPISAQDYSRLSDLEVRAIDEVLLEKGRDKERYKEVLVRLFPKPYKLPSGETKAIWRNK